MIGRDKAKNTVLELLAESPVVAVLGARQVGKTTLARQVAANWTFESRHHMDCFFWKAHTGAELDLLIHQGQERLGFEIKRTSAPKLTPSIRSAMETLQLSRLYVIHAGSRSFPLAENIIAMPLREVLE